MSEQEREREKAWAKKIDKLAVDSSPAGALNLNVVGRQVVGPLQGFGQMWQKTYRLRLNGLDLDPAAVVRYWKEHLPELMPDDSRFYPSLTGVQPGEVILINATLPGIPGTIATGVLILYADEESFTVMTPQGHPESGFNTFSALEEDGIVIAQIKSLARANDPIYEFGFRFMGGSKQQERIWRHVLTRLGSGLGLGQPPEIELIVECVDTRLQWSQVKNVWHNAAVRSVAYGPVRLARRVFGGR